MAKNNKPSKLGEILKNINRGSIEDQAKKERDKAYDIRSIFEKMELELISSMKKAFFFHQNEEQKEGFSWEQWQLSKLRAIEKYRKRNKKIIGSYARPIQATINRELKGNYQKGQGRLQKFFGKVKELLKKVKDIEVNLPNDMAEQLKTREYIDKELGRETTPPPDKDFFGVNDKKLNALQSTVENDLKVAQQAVLRKMDDVYRQTIFKTHVYLQGGVKSLNKAIDMATKDFLNQGINCIVYKDGKKVNIASYAEMALRTASQRATFLGEGKKRDEFGIHLVVVSAHANTCEKCMQWQGKVLIDDVFSHPSQEYIQEYSKKYSLLSEAIKAGLLHPNCRHTVITYFEGITQIPTIPDGDAAIKVYEAEQKQRALEREIRKWKRIEAGTLDPLAQGDAFNKVKQLQSELKRHLGKNSELRRNYEREENKIPISNVGDNGFQNKNKYLDIPDKTLEHANKGDFTKPKNPKNVRPGEIKLKGGGHGQSGIELLNERGIEYNIVKEYDNGVRVGNVPKHKMKAKQTGTGQAWFPKDWADKDIEIAAKYVANLKVKSEYIIENKYLNEQLSAVFKYANYKGVTVGVCYEVKKGEITTIFPDETQRMIGGNMND
jgi:hypothetical protein